MNQKIAIVQNKSSLSIPKCQSGCRKMFYFLRVPEIHIDFFVPGKNSCEKASLPASDLFDIAHSNSQQCRVTTYGGFLVDKGKW